MKIPSTICYMLAGLTHIQQKLALPAYVRMSIQNYWVFGLLPSSDVLKLREHNVTESGPISILR
jgi:hypothetical protein